MGRREKGDNERTEIAPITVTLHKNERKKVELAAAIEDAKSTHLWARKTLVNEASQVIERDLINNEINEGE